MTNRHRRIHDHRIKEQIVRSRGPNLFPELHIPPSTARSWIRRGLEEVVWLHLGNASEDILRDRIATPAMSQSKLENFRNGRVSFKLLPIVVIEVSGGRCQPSRAGRDF